MTLYYVLLLKKQAKGCNSNCYQILSTSINHCTHVAYQRTMYTSIHQYINHTHHPVTYQCLDHEDPPLPHVVDKLIDVHVIYARVVNPLQHGIQGDERTSPTDSGTAVDQQLTVGILVVTFLNSTDERNERGCELWYSVIWPGGEVILDHIERFRIGVNIL